MALSAKQKKFVEEYLIDLNATQAAIRAGYSERTARSVGHENLTKPDIQAAILDAKLARAERTELTADWVIQRLREEANDRREGASHSARVRALELLGKHMDIFEERFRVVGEGSNEPTPYEKRLAEFRKRYGGSSGQDHGAAPGQDSAVDSGADASPKPTDPPPAKPPADGVPGT